MAYASIADVRAYLNVTSSAEDVLLGAMCARAQAIVDNYTRRTFEADTDTVVRFNPLVDADGRTLWFTDRDLAALTTVVNGDGVTIPATAYVFEPSLGPPWFGVTLKFYSGYTWQAASDPEDSIALTGRWAFSTTAPADITQATVRLAAWLYRQRDNTTDVEMLRITPQGFPLVPPTLPADVKAILDLRRRQ